jgi:Ca2+-binding EF-hand superfamily protein
MGGCALTANRGYDLCFTCHPQYTDPFVVVPPQPDHKPGPSIEEILRQLAREREREQARILKILRDCIKEEKEFAEHAEWRVISLSFNVMEEMLNLFRKLDTQNAAEITQASFEGWFGHAPIHFLREKFDTNGDAKVSVHEFIHGFFDHALNTPFATKYGKPRRSAVPANMTVEKALKWVENKVSKGIRDLVQVVNSLCHKNLKTRKPCYVMPDIGKAIVQPLPTSLRFDKDTVKAFAKQYLKLDKTRKGYIQMMDLSPTYQSIWPTVLKYFDSDSNTVISRDEYVKGVVQLAMEQTLSLRSDLPCESIADLLNQIDGQVNHFLQVKLNEFCDSLPIITQESAFRISSSKRKRNSYVPVANEYMKITKNPSSQKGQRARVVDPNWAQSGYVKVVMDSGPHKKRIKTYRKDEVASLYD